MTYPWFTHGNQPVIYQKKGTWEKKARICPTCDEPVTNPWFTGDNPWFTRSNGFEWVRIMDASGSINGRVVERGKLVKTSILCKTRFLFLTNSARNKPRVSNLTLQFLRVRLLKVYMYNIQCTWSMSAPAGSWDHVGACKINMSLQVMLVWLQLAGPRGAWMSKEAKRFFHSETVDGRSPAPVDRWFTPLFTRFYTSQVVQDFFHQQ